MTDPDPGSETEWRAGPPQDLVWAELGDDYVVYHRPSGRTHFLNSATVALLREVLVGPRNARAAAEELAAREAAAVDAEFFAAVAVSLQHLEHLGLVDRVHG